MKGLVDAPSIKPAYLIFINYGFYIVQGNMSIGI